MLAHKVVQHPSRGKVEAEYDAYVALDWSLKTMAVAYMVRRDQAPRVFERLADLKDLKVYHGSLKGRVIPTFEESGFAHCTETQRKCDRMSEHEQHSVREV